MAKSLKFDIPYNGEPHSFDADVDLSLGNLRQIKAWYPELGTFSRFITGFQLGDPDAWACVVWIIRKKAGEKNVPEPRNMDDFGIGELLNAAESERTKRCEVCEGRGWHKIEDEPDPLGSQPSPASASTTSSPQPDTSTEIPTNSEGDISGS